MDYTLHVTDRDGKELCIEIGDTFKATSPEGRTYLYRYNGIMPDGCGYDIYLYNETTGTYLNVEEKWFTQRHIRQQERR